MSAQGFARVDEELDAVRKRLETLETLMPSAVLDLIQGDPHQWSNRPCPTCRPITTMLGRPFGCYRYQADKQR